MAQPTTITEYAVIRRRVGRSLGFDRDPTNWTADEVTDVDDAIVTGLSWFYNPEPLPGERTVHEWTFLRPVYDLTLSASYATGTIAVASGVVTLTSGTWPSNAAAGELTVSGVTYDVDTRDSDSQITLVDTTVTVTAGASYTLGFSVVDMPEDFAMLDGPITYRPGEGTWKTPIEIVSDRDIRKMRQYTEYTSYPRQAAIRQKSHSGAAAAGFRWQLVLYPTPDSAYVVSFAYKINPNTLDATNKYAVGTAEHSETVNAAILAAADAMINDNAGMQMQIFKERLRASIYRDRAAHESDNLGYNSNVQSPYWFKSWSVNGGDNVTHEGRVSS